MESLVFKVYNYCNTPRDYVEECDYEIIKIRIIDED